MIDFWWGTYFGWIMRRKKGYNTVLGWTHFILFYLLSIISFHCWYLSPDKIQILSNYFIDQGHPYLSLIINHKYYPNLIRSDEIHQDCIFADLIPQFLVFVSPSQSLGLYFCRHELRKITQNIPQPTTTQNQNKSPILGVPL